MVPLPFKVDWTPSFPAARRKVGYLAPMSIREVLAHKKITRIALALLIVPAYFLGAAILLHFLWMPSPTHATSMAPHTLSVSDNSLALEKTQPEITGLK